MVDSLWWGTIECVEENRGRKGTEGGKGGGCLEPLAPQDSPRRLLEEDAAWRREVPWSQRAENHLEEPMANTWEVLSDGRE